MSQPALLLTDVKLRHQQLLEDLFNKNQLMPRIRQAFQDCEDVPFAKIMQTANIPEKFGFDVLAQMAVRKRANVPTLIGCLRHHTGDSQSTAHLLEAAVVHNLVSWSSRESQFIVIYTIAAALQEELDRYQFPLPMVVPPRKIEDNLDTGYLSGRGSVILRDNHHEDDVCLDHLNRLNQTAFSINLDTATTVQNCWKKLDKKHPDESFEDWKKRRKQFHRYTRVAKGVLNILLQEGNKLYLTHRYDKRGRTYAIGFHVNPQGTDWNKAVLELAHKEQVQG